MAMFRHFDRNTTGRDYVVGDIHGCFGRLREAMFDAGFDPKRDRLFSVGDLVDRGPESDKAVAYLSEPWFFAVRGNHEQMAIEVDAGIATPELHCINGGMWFYALTEAERNEAGKAFGNLPLAIEIDTADGLVGIVHAEVPGDSWDDFRDWLTNGTRGLEHIERFALWGRDLIRGRSTFQGIAGVTKVYVGHTPVKERQIIGNVHYIDTGACYGRKLTLICLTDGLTYEAAA